MTGAVDLTLDNLAQLPPAVRSCVYWELDAPAATRAAANGAGALEKEAWFSSTLLEWGRCGRRYTPTAGWPASPSTHLRHMYRAQEAFPPPR